MAGLGAKLFTAYSKLTAAQVNGYLMDQSIMRFANATARDAAFGGAGEPTLAEGMTCYLDDTNVLQSYTGSAWVSVASSSTVADVSSGLVYVKQQSFSGSGTAQFTNCFNSSYDNYRIVFGCTTAPAGGAIIYTSMLNGTTPNNTAGSYLYYEAGNTWSGTADVGASAGTTSWFGIRSDTYFFGTMEIQNPYNSIYTTFQSEGIDAAQSWQVRGQQIRNASYDGIQFYHAGGNLNGLTMFCYGYRKS
ncbi:hypothetical protein UFOVP1226_15 [uncultured Caudovirales phage]|uniref:Uncharacterized protein n=1 Tax=uncultured Caudovirales phage TaxID=2100421 RepID=A0A6J5LT67_9CAUD|nr:hypothetical protein UFOVP278_27 [uncultured Caudovirales phage]CAB4191086.1 hypothetical protein UFOVP1226_15 [uncultured Caudovirales phage]